MLLFARAWREIYGVGTPPMAATFLDAYEHARDSHGPEVWQAMKMSEQTAAIYREMRRIDAEHVAAQAAALRPKRRSAKPPEQIAA